MEVTLNFLQYKDMKYITIYFFLFLKCFVIVFFKGIINLNIGYIKKIKKNKKKKYFLKNKLKKCKVDH